MICEPCRATADDPEDPQLGHCQNTRCTCQHHPIGTGLPTPGEVPGKEATTTGSE